MCYHKFAVPTVSLPLVGVSGVGASRERGVRGGRVFTFFIDGREEFLEGGREVMVVPGNNPR